MGPKKRWEESFFPKKNYIFIFFCIFRENFLDLSQIFSGRFVKTAYYASGAVVSGEKDFTKKNVFKCFVTTLSVKTPTFGAKV